MKSANGRAAIGFLVLAAVVWGPAVAADDRLEWHWAALGDGIGATGLSAVDVDVDADGTPEVVGSGGSGRFWFVLSLAGGEYVQEWASKPSADWITRMFVAQGGGGAELEVFVAAGTEVRVYDGATRELRTTVAVEAEEVRGLAAGDVDADGEVEIVLCDLDDLFVYDLATGVLEVRKFGFGGRDLVIGEIDGDAPLEIGVATGSAGHVLDGSSLAVEWGRPSGFGWLIRLADLDGDDLDEVVSGTTWEGLTVFDPQTDTELYTVAVDHLAAVRAADVDVDGSLELIYGEGQWGAIHVLEGATGSELWSVWNPEHGVTDIASADVDGDGVREVLWGAGYTSSGEDNLFSADGATHAIEWQSVDLRGPFLGLDHGDIDADGDPELLWTTFSSRSGYGDGLYLIHDAVTRQLEYVSDESAARTDLWKARTANIDGDPQLEICITAETSGAGTIACYDGLTHAEEWHHEIPDGLSFRSLEIVDVDGDGQLEVVAGVGRDHTGGDGCFVYAFRAASGLLHWRSPDLDEGWPDLTLLQIDDVDGDDQPEVVAGARHSWVAILDGVTGLLELDNVALDVTALDTADRDGDGTAEVFVGTEDGFIRRLDPATGSLSDLLGPYPGAVRGLTLAATRTAVPDYVFAVDGDLTIVNGSTLAVDWHDGPWGDAAGRDDSLMVADVDRDGLQEIVLNTGVGVAIFEIPRDFLFIDGFESGDTGAWSSAVP